APRSPFAKLLDIYPGISQDGVGSAFMEIQEMHRQTAGYVQGGIIVALADFAFARAVHSVSQPGQPTVTIELKMNFISPAKDGKLTATARILSQGRRIVVGEMEVTGEDQALIARGLGTFMLLQPGS
ncbi:MAG: PaaI family thioesterase, partial [Chloroflexi bacterium]|nr:PaaI family thioesterase [Chloroflexota bacterium]